MKSSRENGVSHLLVQPGEGVKPLLEAIDGAKERVEIAIFRFDRPEVEKALGRAAARGVVVQALIAYTNRGGEKSLRQLEMRLLEKGVTVARTADDLVRYHNKLIIVDRQVLFLLGFNFTYLDIEHSRSFGVMTRRPDLVAEAARLFEADTKRQKYEPGSSDFVVSPANARKELSALIKGAKKQLLIYDPKVGDPAMIRLLQERARDGVDVRIIGKLTRNAKLATRELTEMRLHTRSIIRDGEIVFTGSQSLRAAELETRREAGVILHDANMAEQMLKVFEEDWAASQPEKEAEEAESAIPAQKAAKRAAKAFAKGLPPIAPVLELIVKEAVGNKADLELNASKLEQVVREAVRDAVEESIRDAVQELVEQET